MRDYYLTFVNDDVDKMRIFGALLDAGLKDFVITETEQFTYDNWKRTVAENAQVDHFRDVRKMIDLVEE